VPSRAPQAIIVGTAIVYFAVVAAISAWAIRRTRTADDFFVAGRRIGIWTLSIAAMAATISGFAFIGGPGLVYRLGIGAVFINLPIAFTSAMAGWVLAGRLRRLAEARNIYTIPEVIGVRFRSPSAQGLSAVAIVVAVICYMATNVLALGIVVDAIFGTGLVAGIWIGTAITVAYSASGGILAGVYTDLFEGAVKMTASALVFLYVLRVGHGLTGMSESILAADPAFLSPWGKTTPLAAMSFFFVFGIGTLGQPHVLHKFFMIRDPALLRWYPLIMSAAMVVSLLLFVGVGLVVKALVANASLPPLASADDATPTFLLRFTPVAVAAIVFSGVTAAIMSTVNAFLSVGAAALTHDIPAALGHRVGDELRWGRISTVVIALVAVAVAVYSDTLVAFLGIFGWGLFASTLVPSLAIGLNWTGATRAGAIASILTGLVVTISLESLAHFRVFVFPAGVNATALALVTSLLVFFAVSWGTKHRAEAELDPDVRAIVER
jgi:Na+/proline symporter